MIVFSVVLCCGFAVYLHMTFKCQELTAISLGHEPQNLTGFWFNNTNNDADLYSTNVWWPKMCSWPSTGICDDFVDSEGGRAKEQFVLVNYTEKDLGTKEPESWSPSPLAYQGYGCWSEGGSNAGAYFLNGIFAAFAMATGASALLVSAVVFILQKTVGTCCGKPLVDEEAPVGMLVE